MASIVTSEGTPYIVGGRFLKNQIAFKCKKTAQYQSILNKQGLKTSKRLQKFNTKFKAIQRQLPRSHNQIHNRIHAKNKT